MDMESKNLEDDNMSNGIQKRRKNKPFVGRKKKKRPLNDVPTAEELNTLREAETMFNSHLFKIQMEDVMMEQKQKMKLKSKFSLWLETLKQFLINIPESSRASIEEFNLGDNVKIPIIQTPVDNKGSFQFIPPTVILEIGSFATGTVCSSSPVLDIAVEIPDAIWQNKDFLNHRYHRKRAFYLAYIAYSLKKEKFVTNLKFSYQNNSYLKPVLHVSPKDSPNFCICITACPSGKAFKTTRFSISKNNVRPSWFLGTNEEKELATPYYNSSVLADMTLPGVNEFLIDVITSQNVKEAVVFLKLWAKERGLTSGYGRLNGFILTLFTAYLLKKKKISPLMSPYQIFRCCLLALRNGTLTEQPITLCESIGDSPSVDEFKEHCSVVFIDASGCFNICWGVTKETILMVKHEAKLGINILDRETPDGFSHLFLYNINFYKKFEYFLHFNGPNKFKKYVSKLGLKDCTVDSGTDLFPVLFPKICSILRSGLNKRIQLIDVMKLPHAPWLITDSPPDPNLGQVTIGFLLHPDSSFNNLEKGPLADSLEAKDFRKFWGEKAQLRRFQDGTIREAVFWPAATAADRRAVFFSIVNDILERHLSCNSHVIQNGIELDKILHLHEDILSAEFPPYGTGEETFERIMASFNELCKQLRALNGLPLSISSIQGVSPAFRFTEVFPPIPISHKEMKQNCLIEGHVMKLKQFVDASVPYTPVLKAIVNLEGSGKWPDDIEAIKRVKAAFQIKIAELVKSQCSLISVPALTHTDIYKDGFVFRFQVASHKEIFLMKQFKTEIGTVKIRETKESLQMEIETEILPKLNSILHGLYQQHNSFGAACRLAKRWISAQLKQGFMHDLTVELLVAYLYVHPEPYSCPSTPQVAFIRFLTLLVYHDWISMPLIINFNNELKKEEIEEIYSTFTAQKSNLPTMVVSTPFDKRGSMWTKNMPPELILKRIKILAVESLKLLDGILSNTKKVDVKGIFRPPLINFDVMIYIKRDQIPRLSHGIDILTTDTLPQYEPYKKDPNEVYPVVDFDPVQKYLTELRENFSEFAFFLYDIYGGDFIAVAWKKSAFTAQDLKFSHANCRKLCSDGTQVVPDLERILEDFQLLGSKIVEKIVTVTENWQLP